jgi:hypothetical protein
MFGVLVLLLLLLLLTCIVVVEKLTVYQLLRKFAAFYGIQMRLLFFLFFLLSIEFLLGTVYERDFVLFNVCSSKNCPSARCSSAANVVCRNVDVFGAKTVSLPYFIVPLSSY